jgi:hypothetical protein
MTTILYDWIVSEKSVRGSRTNDGGLWQSTSTPPISYDPETCTVTTKDGKKYRIYSDDICKAAHVDIKSMKVLASLPR